MSYDKK